MLTAIINLSYLLGADVDISQTKKILLAHPFYPIPLAVSHVLRELDIENKTLHGTIIDLSGGCACIYRLNKPNSMKISCLNPIVA